MLIRAKPIAAILRWLVQPGHPPASTWTTSQHQSPMQPRPPQGSSMGLTRSCWVRPLVVLGCSQCLDLGLCRQMGHQPIWHCHTSTCKVAVYCRGLVTSITRRCVQNTSGPNTPFLTRPFLFWNEVPMQNTHQCVVINFTRKERKLV